MLGLLLDTLRVVPGREEEVGGGSVRDWDSILQA